MDERTTLRYIDELQGQIDQLRRIIKGGGGGGSIVINPEGSATTDLEKIKSGDTIYGLNYNKNANRPQINGNLLTGNKNSKQLNIAEEMSEAAYAALSSKNENEIYFLTENAPIFTETDTVAASGITWSAGQEPDTYEATLSYSVVDTDTTGVVGVTCDNDLITIGDPTFSVGTVSVPMVCDDPSEITGDIEFVYTLEQPAGKKSVYFNGKEYTEPHLCTFNAADIIKATTNVTEAASYTAVKDCFLAITYSSTGQSASHCEIDGVQVLYSGGGNFIFSALLPLKKGQVLTFTPAGSYNSYTVYGIQ